MIKGTFPVNKFQSIETPFYYYDVDLLKQTLDVVKSESEKYGYEAHYAVKANTNPKLLKIISAKGLGADCVSGNEIKACIEAGFSADKIVFAGVGKTDKEINYALEQDIFCFNVESIPEMEIINELAAAKNKTARIALRINLNIDAHTHQHITTGLTENKFGLDMSNLDNVIAMLQTLKSLRLKLRLFSSA